MKKYQSFALSVLVISVLLAILYQYPRHEVGSELKAYQDKLATLTAENKDKSTIIPIMSFNLRYEGSERNPDNNWVNRISRVEKVVQEYKPWVMGTQELLHSQALQLQSLLSPMGYKMVIQEGPNAQYTGTAIFYNENLLELVDSDHFWLSLTPRVQNTKNWDSVHPRMLTMGRFRIRDGSKNTAQELIVYNAHLDHMGGEARINQAKIIKEEITARRQQFPDLPIVLTGDFNSAPGQAAYQILTDSSTNSNNEIVLLDSFIESAEKEYTGLPNTFHAWIGARIHSYLIRALLYPTFVGHAIYCQRSFEFTFPSQSGRYHIDWILYSSRKDFSRLIPRFVSIVGIKYSNYSSDHFPIITLFELTRKKD